MGNASPQSSRKILIILLCATPLLIFALTRNSAEHQTPIEAAAPGVNPESPEAAQTAPAGPSTAFKLYSPETATAQRRQVSIQEIHGPDLAKTLFVSAQALPMLDIRIVFDAGGARDGTTPGLAALVSALIPEGTKSQDSGEIAARFETIGASFRTGSYRDMATMELRTLVKPELMQPALQMMTELIREASFPDDALARERKRVLAGLQQKRQNPARLASDRYYAELYGTHPYASPSDGTLDSIPGITRAQILEFFRTYYNRDNALIAMVGAIDADQAREIATQISAALPAGKPAPAPPEPKMLNTMQEASIEFPSAQTHLMIGTLGVRRTSEELLALQLANEILGGGGLVSVLSQEIREQRGLAYSVYSYFSPMRVPGPFTMGLQTRADQAGEALQIALQTLRTFATEGPTEEQFKRAKQHLLGSFPLQTASNRSIVGYLGAIGFYGLPLDYLETYRERLEKVTREQAADAFRKVVDPDRLLIVQVGPGPDTGDAAQ